MKFWLQKPQGSAEVVVLIVRGECRPGADHAAGFEATSGAAARGWLQRAVLQPRRDRVDGACERGRIEAVGPRPLACTKLASEASVASAMSRLRLVASLRHSGTRTWSLRACA
jgi:hypothetical protein